MIENTTREKRTFMKRRISINFLLMIEFGKGIINSESKDSVWFEVKKITDKYKISKNTVIHENDWAKIILLLFPELLTSTRLISTSSAETNKKNPLNKIDFSMLKCKNPNPSELLKIFPPETRSDWHIRTPYNAFFNFWGYFVGITWTSFPENSKRHFRYRSDSFNKPDIIIKEIYSVLLPWIINRAQCFRDYIDGAKFNSDMFRVKNHEHLVNILKYSFEDIRSNHSIESKKEVAELKVHEKLIWIITWEILLIDILTMNLEGIQALIEKLIEMLSEYRTVEGVAKHIENILKIAKEQLLF